ncbi:hypothetical protein LC653_40415 [Nostoc sp. CHAB 5784]|uniref:hypothetical protein n=1 Tax=Nostoc mirabile TaxID=2907820 RepID=UPI001E4D69FB|nr:hypothetical protein [Nostoc mirabile]MCC5669906.1 hypothetical protein [Nostoc mirabile CHAB5784]
MSHINNQTQDLYSIELVQDLDHEAAATVSGGALYLYDKYGQKVLIDELTGADPDLGSAKNKASSYKVTGTKDWKVWIEEGYKPGKGKTLYAGTSGDLTGTYNNNVESAKPV